MVETVLSNLVELYEARAPTSEQLAMVGANEQTIGECGDARNIVTLVQDGERLVAHATLFEVQQRRLVSIAGPGARSAGRGDGDPSEQGHYHGGGRDAEVQPSLGRKRSASRLSVTAKTVPPRALRATSEGRCSVGEAESVSRSSASTTIILAKTSRK